MTNVEKNDQYPKLIFPPLSLRARRKGDRTEVWNSVRRIWQLLTPEEWVRRHVVEWLVGSHGVQRVNIVEEYGVDVNNQPQRADIVVFDRDIAVLLIECKAADVAIDRSTVDQAFRYNAVVGARYVMLTNGLTAVVFDRGEVVFRFPQQ